jgi:Terpene synthase family 2, C-terminal metal binding
MFDGLYWQFKNAQLNILPTFDDYIRIRQYLGAAHLSTDSLEVTGNIYLSEEVYFDPAVSRLTECSRNCVCFANDLFSLGKESEESQNAGEYNLVGVMRNKYKMSIPEAIKAAAEHHDDQMREFVSLTKVACHFDPATNAMIERYIGALKLQMIANIEWSTKETDRYPHKY